MEQKKPQLNLKQVEIILVIPPLLLYYLIDVNPNMLVDQLWLNQNKIKPV